MLSLRDQAQAGITVVSSPVKLVNRLAGYSVIRFASSPVYPLVNRIVALRGVAREEKRKERAYVLDLRTPAVERINGRGGDVLPDGKPTQLQSPLLLRRRLKLSELFPY